jgi:hypothetical protein
MNIKLKINGEERTFVSTFISARSFRQVLEMNKRMDFNNLSPEDMDEIVGLIRNIFNNEFTVDEFYDGLPVQKLVPTMKETFQTINGTANGEKTEKK